MRKRQAERRDGGVGIKERDESEVPGGSPNDINRLGPCVQLCLNSPGLLGVKSIH